MSEAFVSIYTDSFLTLICECVSCVSQCMILRSSVHLFWPVNCHCDSLSEHDGDGGGGRLVCLLACLLGLFRPRVLRSTPSSLLTAYEHVYALPTQTYTCLPLLTDISGRVRTEGSGLPITRALQPVRTSQSVFHAKTPNSGRHVFLTSWSLPRER